MNVTFSSPEWEQTRHKLDHGQAFARMTNTPYYRDAVYPQFSRAEYERRFDALRAKMDRQDLDVVIWPLDQAIGALAAVCCGFRAIGNGTASALTCCFRAAESRH